MIKTIIETAWHHSGDFYYFKKLIRKLLKLKPNYIKIHITLNFDEYMSNDHKNYSMQKKMLFNEKQWTQILQIIKKSKIEIICLVNDIRAIKFCKKFKFIKNIELHSVCANDLFMMKEIKKNKKIKKIFVGCSGMGIDELDFLYNFFKKNLVFMHGFQSYPTKIEKVNFNRFEYLKNKFNKVEHGYADHTFFSDEMNISNSIIGAAKIGNYLEKHVSITPGKKRIDWESAIHIQTMEKIIKILKNFNLSLKNKINFITSDEISYGGPTNMKKTAKMAKAVKKGQISRLNDFIFIRTSKKNNTKPLDAIRFLGKKYKRNFNQYQIFKK
mgnify:CR=1 FL=1